MRYDDHDTFGNESTGRATLAWAATPTTIVRASYGEGFKAPTLFQLFSEFGNEALAPERADAWDAGVEQHLLNDALLLSATYFGRNTRQHDRLRLVLPLAPIRAARRGLSASTTTCRRPRRKASSSGSSRTSASGCASTRTTRTWRRPIARPAELRPRAAAPSRPDVQRRDHVRVASRPDHDRGGDSRRPHLRQRVEHRRGGRLHGGRPARGIRAARRSRAVRPARERVRRGVRNHRALRHAGRGVFVGVRQSF